MLEWTAPEMNMAAQRLALLIAPFVVWAIYYCWKSTTWTEARRKAIRFYWAYVAAAIEVEDGP
jgi:hypothetical protein